MPYHRLCRSKKQVCFRITPSLSKIRMAFVVLCRSGGMVDTGDLKSPDQLRSYWFESSLRHQFSQYDSAVYYCINTIELPRLFGFRVAFNTLRIFWRRAKRSLRLRHDSPHPKGRNTRWDCPGHHCNRKRFPSSQRSRRHCRILLPV